MSVLADTSVLVDHLRGRVEAVQLVFNVIANGQMCCSCLTMIELAAGMRQHQLEAMRVLERFVDIVEVDTAIGERACELAIEWTRSHGGIDPVDFVVAATAQVQRLSLLTTNVKHFPMLPALVAPY